MTQSQRQSPLHVTVRFSTSIPDLDLDIPYPATTTVISLKQLLRDRLSSKCRLRLIYQGRLLPDTSALSSVLRNSSVSPPLSSATTPSQDGKGKGKGKGKAVDGPEDNAPRIYINCSIGDDLSAEELADEQAAAEKPPEESSSTGPKASTWTRPRPRGFDRLLQAGFSPSEISTLRTQFASIHNDRVTTDAMPSPDTLRNLEDNWIDSNAGEVPTTTNPLDDDISRMSTVLDILIRGMMVGFFFPLGSMTWLLRQGVWSDKWQIFVGSGVVLSLTVGLVMGISGDRWWLARN